MTFNFDAFVEKANKVSTEETLNQIKGGEQDSCHDSSIKIIEMKTDTCKPI